MASITIEDIKIDIIKKNIKNLHLSVHPPDGRVRIAVPNSMNVDQFMAEISMQINILRVGASTLAGEGVRPASAGVLR